MARPPRLERGTLCLEGRCSIQLSYGRMTLIYNWLQISICFRFGNLILRSDIVAIKQLQKPDDRWQSTPYANLICHKPSNTYVARIRINGKLIRRSLKTTVVSVAKL